MNLNDKALLVQLNISQWMARKLDKRVSKDIAHQHQASEYAGRYTKSLLPAGQSLSTVHNLTSAIRKEFLDNTLPWGLAGTQMLPSTNYLAFMSHFRKRRGEWEAAVAAFLNDYNTMRVDAQRELGSLYDPSEYPTDVEIKAKFSIDLQVFPVPTSDFRVSLSSDEVSRLQREIEERTQRAQQDAHKEVWQRLFKRVSHVAERLSAVDGRFHDSVIDNTREDCALLSRLNFAQDPNLEAMRLEVEKKLAQLSPEALRSDTVLRLSAADEANQIIERMKAFM